MSSRDYVVRCVSEALSPITHMQGASGNESIVAREPVATPRGVQWVPFLSGNAIRHRCVREPGARWLVREYGLGGTLTLQQLNFLFHGGSLTEGGGREDTRRIADFQRIFPLGRLVGGCLPDQILSGSLQVWRGALACEENRAYLGSALGDDLAAALPARLRPGEALVSGYQYTRGDAAPTAAVLVSEAARIEQSEGTSASNLMIFAGQSVVRGAAFVHGFTIPHGSELELGALLWSLRLWQASGGTVGGQAARGHGRLALSLVGDVGGQEEAVDAYLDHARAAKDEAVDWLRKVFMPRAEKAAKGRGRKAPAGEPEPLLAGEA